MASAPGRQRVAPPLQADLAQTGLADHVAHAGDFSAEGVQREQVFAQTRRREQVGNVAVAVVPTKRSGAIVVVIH